jgi:hypothetical protein
MKDGSIKQGKKQGVCNGRDKEGGCTYPGEIALNLKR